MRTDTAKAEKKWKLLLRRVEGSWKVDIAAKKHPLRRDVEESI